MNTATTPMVTAKMVPVRFLPGAHQRVGGVDAEVVVVVVGHVAARPHEDPNLVLQLHHVLRVRSFDKNHKLQVRHEKIAEGAERDEYEVVLAHAEGGAHLFRHADHREVMAAHLQFLANGIDRGEELIHNVLANEANPRIVVVVLVADVAPIRHLFPADVGVAGGDS